MCVWVYIYICDYVCVYVYIYMHEKYLHSLLDEMSVQKLNSSRFVTVSALHCWILDAESFLYQVEYSYDRKDR